MVELSPFRVIVDLHAPKQEQHQWVLSFRYRQSTAVFSSPNQADVQAKHSEWDAKYGPYSPPWSVTFDQPGAYYRTHVQVWLEPQNPLNISEPADWTPEPLSNVDYYRKHFDSVGTMRFSYPAPETAWPAATWSGWQIPDLEQFEILSVEKEII